MDGARDEARTGPAEDVSLVEGLRRGDSAAFDRAYHAFAPRLYRFLYRLSGRRELAEDLLQESFLRLARHAAGLRADTQLGGWLFTVARNLYRSHRRWSLLDRTRLADLGHQPAGAAPDPEELAQAQQAARTLEQALAGLPPAFREAILLCAIERLEPVEAARVVGIKPEAFRQRLARARGMLRQALAPRGGDR